MQHPDEGIIHAWLDGALVPAESARIEAHVADCSQCAAAVAEARGLIAASSRIVGHLDAVPGNVIPVAGAATPVRKLWIRSTWPALIAASVLVAVGVVANRGRTSREAGLKAVTPASAGVQAPVVAPVTHPTDAAANAPPPQRSIGPAVANPQRENATRVAQQIAEIARPPIDTAGAKTSLPPSAAPRPGAVTTMTAPAAAPAAANVVEQRSDSAPRLSSVVATGASGLTAGSVGGVRGDAVSDRRAPAPAARQTQAKAAFAEDRADADAARLFVGCYELTASTDVLPIRFALGADAVSPAAAGRTVRYVDANGVMTDRIADASWTTDGERVTVSVNGRAILTFQRSGRSVTGSSVNGPRSGSVLACR